MFSPIPTYCFITPSLSKERNLEVAVRYSSPTLQTEYTAFIKSSGPP